MHLYVLQYKLARSPNKFIVSYNKNVAVKLSALVQIILINYSCWISYWKYVKCNTFYLTVGFLGDKLSKSKSFHGGISKYGRIRRLTTAFHHSWLENRQEPAGMKGWDKVRGDTKAWHIQCILSGFQKSINGLQTLPWSQVVILIGGQLVPSGQVLPKMSPSEVRHQEERE